MTMAEGRPLLVDSRLAAIGSRKFQHLRLNEDVQGQHKSSDEPLQPFSESPPAAGIPSGGEGDRVM